MLTENEVGKYWDANAEAWTNLARAGYDTYRDHLNTPAFFELLPDVSGLRGLDIGCGEGHNTRLLVQRGGLMTAIDISPTFIDKAKQMEAEYPGHINYQVASAGNLPFDDTSFDFATSFMCLMDVPQPAIALKEAFRVLKPNGFLQFSITHPCFNTPHRKNLRGPDRITYAIEVGGYFNNLNGKIAEWIFGGIPAEFKMQYSEFKTPIFNWTLTQWLDFILQAGFVIEKINEPYPDDELVERIPSLQDAQLVAYFLHLRCRKPY